MSLHNQLLQQAVATLNNETKDSAIVLIDLYDSFMTVLKNKGDRLGNFTILIFYLLHWQITFT